MKILWNSTTPYSSCGYGVVTKELVDRFLDAGHKVDIATKHQLFGTPMYRTAKLYEGLNIRHLNNMLDRGEYDYILSLWDIWILTSKLHPPKDKWIGYVPIDTEWIAKSYADLLLGKEEMIADNEGPGIQIAMSKHGVRELKSIGIEPLYAPLGVDSKIMRPSKADRGRFRKAYKYDDDNFVIGSVGLNYKDDRKGFVTLIQAFKSFVKTYPKARLYLHTHAEGNKESTIPLGRIIEDLKLNEVIQFTNQEFYDMNKLTRKTLSGIFNSFDVFCLPTKGEGFGMPLIEAQACGVPVITTNSTTGPELVGDTGWLIDVNDDDLRWMPTRTWRYEPKISEVEECLELAYNAWQSEGLGQIKANCRKFALKYGWDRVWKKYWLPIIAVLEERLVNAQ